MKKIKSLAEWCAEQGEYGRNLEKEYIGITENGRHYGINEISYGSKRKVKWKCQKGHEYYAVVGNRTTNRSGCLQCAIEKKLCYRRKNKESV